MPGRLIPNVHREHLPASRYGANPATRTTRDIRINGSEGHPGVIRDVHHSYHHYRSVSEAAYVTVAWSSFLCVLFALLAIAQLTFALRIMRTHTPFLRSSVFDSDGRWASRKAQWILALVPSAVARCCHLLLLISDLDVQAGGAAAAEIAFLFEVSAFFDGAASWLFYTAKVVCVLWWVTCLGRGGVSKHVRTCAVLSGGYAVVLVITVGMSLRYRNLCINYGEDEECKTQITWQATFHTAMACVSCLTSVYLCWEALAFMVSPGLRADSNNRRAKHDADGLKWAALVSLLSILWWALFNVWGCFKTFGFFIVSGETEKYAAANLVLSELLPGAIIALALNAQVNAKIQDIQALQDSQDSGPFRSLLAYSKEDSYNSSMLPMSSRI